MHEFDSKDLKRMFGIPASQIRTLSRAGHIHPQKRAGRLHYSFQDLIVLRTLGTLRAAKIPAQRINRTLREIRASLPGELPLSGLSITAIGDRIVVREGRALRESDTGQYTLALDVIDQGGDLLMIDTRATEPPPHAVDPQSIDDAFEKAFELEDTDAAAAKAAYQALLNEDASHLEARLNLGRLLHLEGELTAAERIYRGAGGAEALLSYNLAVLLEDLNRESDAVSAYREALALDPALADAHFNLARLYERSEQPKAALRHLLAYRRLMNEQGA